MPSAKCLRQAAAACLQYGLQSVQSRLQLNPVPCAQVSKHIYCPDEPDVMKRLQSSPYIEFVQLPGFPDQLLLDLQATILPPMLPRVKDTLASIRLLKEHIHPGHHPSPHPLDQIPAHESTVFTQVCEATCESTSWMHEVVQLVESAWSAQLHLLACLQIFPENHSLSNDINHRCSQLGEPAAAPSGQDITGSLAAPNLSTINVSILFFRQICTSFGIAHYLTVTISVPDIPDP